MQIQFFLEYDLTFFLLLICVALFGYLAIRSRNVRSFQFQISIFVLIWTIGEFANVLLFNGVIYLPYSFEEVGYEIHLGSMIFFSVFLYSRYYYSRKRGKHLIENVETEDYQPVLKQADLIDRDSGVQSELSSSEKKS